MKFLALSISTVLLASCAGTGTSGHAGYGSGTAAAGGEYNRDVGEAVMRGTTQGINPL